MSEKQYTATIMDPWNREKIVQWLQTTHANISMLVCDILFPLAEEEQAVYDLFDQIEHDGFLDEYSEQLANWKIEMNENNLSIRILSWADVDNQYQAASN